VAVWTRRAAGRHTGVTSGVPVRRLNRAVRDITTTVTTTTTTTSCSRSSAFRVRLGRRVNQAGHSTGQAQCIRARVVKARVTKGRGGGGMRCVRIGRKQGGGHRPTTTTTRATAATGAAGTKVKGREGVRTGSPMRVGPGSSAAYRGRNVSREHRGNGSGGGVATNTTTSTSTTTTTTTITTFITSLSRRRRRRVCHTWSLGATVCGTQAGRSLVRDLAPRAGVAEQTRAVPAVSSLLSILRPQGICTQRQRLDTTSDTRDTPDTGVSGCAATGTSRRTNPQASTRCGTGGGRGAWWKLVVGRRRDASANADAAAAPQRAGRERSRHHRPPTHG